LEKLAFDGAHAGHQAIEFREKVFLILLRLLDKIGGGTVTNPLQRIRKLSIQKPHVVLQIQEFLVKLGLLEHGRDLA
jgi:hypothetical protein